MKFLSALNAVTVTATLGLFVLQSGCHAAPLDGNATNPTLTTPGAKNVTFRNPLKIQGADPWMTYYDGYYYLTTTTAVDVKIRRAKRIGELKDAPDQVIWKDDTPGRAANLWAPEIHLLKGDNGLRWYLYYTASGDAEPSHRMFVCESAGLDPMGPYTFKAQLKTDADDKFYAIDGTVLQLDTDGSLYFIWCGRPSSAGQGIYISKMANPWTLSGNRTYIDADGFGSAVVREGPETLQKNGKVFLIYSMCGASTPDYRLGMKVADAKSDLTNPDAWEQYPKLMFARVDQRSVWGPGHNYFFKSPDGKEDWIVYHAKTSTNDTYADRTTRAQPFTWTADGYPDFGLPLSTDTDIPVPSGELAPGQ